MADTKTNAHPWGWLRRRLFGLSVEEVSCARRGFPPGPPEIRAQIDQIGRSFVEGYHTALDEPEAEPLASRLNEAPLEFRGFAFEGAAMALALLDRLAPWRRDRWLTFARGPAAHHVYMVHVGLGWALARLRVRVDHALSKLDPLLGWLVVDGYGFHDGYFHWRQAVDRQVVPPRLSGYALRAYDQGLGRSLWFVRTANPDTIRETIAAFPAARQSDFWSGVGLACTYAGGAPDEAIAQLAEAAGSFRWHAAQGAAFAAKARVLAGNLVEHTERACRILCGCDAHAAARLTDDALSDLPPDEPDRPAYEVWRNRIRSLLAQSTSLCPT